MQNIPIYILFFLIFYFLILFSIQPFIVKQNVKTAVKVCIVFGYAVIPFFIMFAFAISLITH